MSTLGKVLLVFVFLASLGMFYLAARALATLHAHRSIANTYEKRIRGRDNDILKLKGTHEEQEKIEAINPSNNQEIKEGLLQVDRKLDTSLINRGRVWFDCVLLANNGGQLQVQVPQPTPHGINEKNVLYVFEQGPDPPQPNQKGIRDANGRVMRYLGDFAVAAGQDPANPQVSLTPARSFTPQQMQYINASPAQGLLALCEQMPIDIHEVWASAKTDHGVDGLDAFFDFSNLDPPLGADLLAEFKRHGEAAADDPPQRILLELKFLKDAADLGAGELQELQGLGFAVVGLLTPAGDPVLDAEGNPVNIDIKEVIKKDTVAYFMLASPDPEKPGPGQRLIALGIAQEQRRLYHRPLRDYGQIFRDVYQQLPRIETRRKDHVFSLKRVKEEEMLTLENQKKAKALQAELLTEQGTLKRERAAVLAVQDEYTRQLKTYNDRIKQLDEENQKLAAQLRKLQLLHAARINERVRKVGAGKP